MSYAYLIKCKETGEFYYGVRFARNCSPEDLWVTYFTSSKYVKELIKKYGKESFEYEVRKTFDSADAARKWEHKVLRRMKVIHRSDFLNKTDNVAICSEAALRGCKNQSPEVRIKIGRKLGLSNKGKKRSQEWKERNTQRMVGNTYKLGKKESMETRLKKSIAHLGKPSGMLGKHHSEATKAIISMKSTGKPSAMLGKKHTDDTRARMSVSQRGTVKNLKEVQCPHCERVGKGPNMSRYHFDNCRSKGV